MTKHFLDRRIFLVAASSLALSACGGNLIGPPEAPQMYVLKPSPLPPQQGPKVDWALSILRPDASSALDSERIALAKGDTQLDYYANAVWPDPLSNLVQTALVAGFEATGRIASVSREGDAMHADYSLAIDLRDFEARYATPDAIPTVALVLVAHMADAHSRKIVDSLTVTLNQPAQSNSVDSVVQAFDVALSQAIGQITQWALNLPPPAPGATAADITQPTRPTSARTLGQHQGAGSPPPRAPGAQEIPVPGSATPPAP